MPQKVRMDNTPWSTNGSDIEDLVVTTDTIRDPAQIEFKVTLASETKADTELALDIRIETRSFGSSSFS